ncbi:MAG: hypothetical protein WAL56_16420 [Candidatus Sulfotelmatobacter sp.]
MESFEKQIAGAILNLIRSRRAASSADLSATNASGPIAPAKIREARFSDFAAVARLKQRGGLNPDSYENWQRLWQRNPALLCHEVERPIGWVLEADGALVGYLGNISLSYRYGDKTLSAVTAHGLVVDPPYRAMGLTLVAAYFRQKSVDLFISTTAIEAVGKIALAFKSSPLPQPDYDTALFWVLRPYGFARALMNKLKAGPALSQIGSMLTSLAVGADKIRRRWPSHISSSLTISEIGLHEIGGEFQTFWTEKQKESCRLLADRSPAALRWHFEIPGDRGSANVLCCYKGSDLVGYTVVRNDTNTENGLRTSIIADLVAKDDDSDVVQTLLGAAYQRAKKTGSHTFEVLGFPSSIRQVATAWNPYRRKYPACPFFYKAANPELHKTLSDATVWYPSPYDGDATLIRPSYATTAPRAENSVQDSRDTNDNLPPAVLEPEHSEVF